MSKFISNDLSSILFVLIGVRAKHKANTFLAPAFCKTLAHSSKVAPVVNISSNSKIVLFFTFALDTLKAPLRLLSLCALSRPVWCGVSLILKRISVWTLPLFWLYSFSKSPLWLNPLSFSLFSWIGIGTTISKSIFNFEIYSETIWPKTFATTFLLFCLRLTISLLTLPEYRKIE